MVIGIKTLNFFLLIIQAIYWINAAVGSNHEGIELIKLNLSEIWDAAEEKNRTYITACNFSFCLWWSY